MFGKIGILELIVILAIALLLFGGKVANLGPALGKAIRGFKKELNFVGYKVSKSGNTVTLGIGYSHPVYFYDGDGITFEVPNETTLIVNGIDKQQVGQVAANVRAKRPPEPYKGKGIKYADEYVRRKAGKAGKK